MKCIICNQESQYVFDAKILNKYEIKYYQCPDCKFLHTEQPFWLDEAYSESINISDTGILLRNLNLSKITTLLIFFFFDKNKKYLDFAGGYGIFTRLMRDIGFDFFWKDKYSTNLVARKFEFNTKDSIELITSFESFEHFADPILEIERMLSISKTILFSTDVFENEVPGTSEWAYYGLSHGQHISFYTIETLTYIANKYNLFLYTNNKSIHLLTDKKISSLYFKVILKMNRLGLFYILKPFLKSKTMEDWNSLK